MKRHRLPAAGAAHVDLGCNVEVFTDASILELETLGARVRLMPGDEARHAEAWHLFSGVALPDDDVAAERVLAPLLARTVAPED